MRAAIYLRVSSDRQSREATIDSQRRDVPARCVAAGWPIVREYVDDGASAATGNLANRPGLLALLRDAEAGAFDVVVCQDVDRLSRADLLERSTILGTLARAGVQVATVTGGLLDLSSLAGELTATMQARFAADWLEKHKARVIAGKLTAIERGRKPAGPTPYGLRYDRASHAWAIDDERADVVREIVRRVGQGEPCDAIAADLSARGLPRARRIAWARHAVWRVARCATYLGTWTADKRRGLTVPVPAIVTADEYAAAQAALMAAGRRGLRRTRHVYLLEGRATCGLCEAPIHIQSATGPGVVGWRAPAQYVCARRKVPIGDPCPAPRIETAALDARLWDALIDVVLSERMGEQVARIQRDGVPADDPRAELDRTRAELARLDRAEATLLERVDRITPSALDRQLARIATARATARSALSAAERRARELRVTVAATATLEAALADLRAKLPGASPEDRRALAGLLLGDVEIGAEALSATVHLPIGVSLASASGSSRAMRGRSAGRLTVDLPRRRAA